MTHPTKDAIETEVFGLIREFSPAQDIELRREMTFETVSISSLDVLQIVFRLEETHGVEIDTEGFDQVKSIGDIVDYVHGAIAQGGESTAGLTKDAGAAR